MRGEIYQIEGINIFTFGGADSHDAHLREENINWWKDEQPSDKEYDYALTNIEKHKYSADVIITHTIDHIEFSIYPFKKYVLDYYETNKMLTDLIIEQEVNYKKWFFGHHHMDLDLQNNKVAIFRRILKIEL